MREEILAEQGGDAIIEIDLEQALGVEIRDWIKAIVVVSGKPDWRSRAYLVFVRPPEDKLYPEPERPM